jgi:hypothetical protein
VDSGLGGVSDQAVEAWLSAGPVLAARSAQLAWCEVDCARVVRDLKAVVVIAESGIHCGGSHCYLNEVAKYRGEKR